MSALWGRTFPVAETLDEVHVEALEQRLMVITWAATIKKFIELRAVSHARLAGRLQKGDAAWHKKDGSGGSYGPWTRASAGWATLRGKS
jgi:hypothetical protein